MTSWFEQVRVLRPFMRGLSGSRLALAAATVVGIAAVWTVLLCGTLATRLLLEHLGLPVASGGIITALSDWADLVGPAGLRMVWFAAAGGVLLWVGARIAASVAVARTVAGAEHRLRRAIYRQSYRLAPSLEPGLTDGPLPSERDAFEKVPLACHVMGAWLELTHRGVWELGALVGLALVAEPRLTGLFLALAALCVAVCGWVARHIGARTDRLERRCRHATALLAEMVNFVHMAKALSMEEPARERFDQVVGELVQNRGRMLRLALLRWPVMLALAGLALVFFAGVTYHQIASRALAVDTAALCVAVLVLGAGSAASAWRKLRVLTDGGHALERLDEFFRSEPAVLQVPGARFLEPLSRELRLKHVTVERGGRFLLRDVNIAIEAGSVVAVLSSDAGSYRALAYVVARLMDPDAGSVLIDGVDLRQATLESVRANVGVALDGHYVFTASVRANIAGGEPQRPLEEIAAAAKRAHAHSFVHRMPQGYDTIVGPLGKQLSIGEQYRIALARLIVQNPALAVIEEPRQPMDEESRQLVDDTVRWFARGRTVIFLARRISTLRNADAVVLVRDGRIEAVGTHEELTRTSELYRHMQYALGQRYQHVVAMARA